MIASKLETFWNILVIIHYASVVLTRLVIMFLMFIIIIFNSLKLSDYTEKRQHWQN